MTVNFEIFIKRIGDLFHLALFLVSYPVVLFGKQSSASSFCQGSCVSSFVLDGSALLPGLESNGFMKMASSGAQKLETVYSPGPVCPLQWSPNCC